MAKDRVKVGDSMVILFGCSVPLILRPADLLWKIVGNIFIHGIMDGEALDGDLWAKDLEIC